MTMTDAEQQRIAAVDETEMHIIRHSLGLTYGDKIYRNHFVTGEGSTDYPHCRALVDKGLMRKGAASPLTGGMDAFFVTDEGKALAIAAQPKLTRAQKRYREWLDVADVTNQSFGEWLKTRHPERLSHAN